MCWGFLVDSQIILGTFCTDNHLDLFVIKLSFLVFTFQISFFLNALFYTDEYILCLNNLIILYNIYCYIGYFIISYIFFEGVAKRDLKIFIFNFNLKRVQNI